MSTALVSALSDVSDVLLQNQQNLGGQLNLSKMLGLLQSSQPPAVPQDLRQYGRTRNSSGSSNSSSGSMGGKYSPASPAQVISYPGDNHCLQQRGLDPLCASAIPHRKLDRSISEPANADRNNNSLTPTPKNVNSSRYKTELCRPFEENGFCKYGDKCQFAHGENELRNLNRHPKYKTELCRTFHSVGFCPYGPRCHFIHNEDERKLSQINHLKHQQAQHQAQQQQQQQLQVVQQLLAQAQGSSSTAPGVPRSAPQTVQQPRGGTSAKAALNFSLSLPPMVRDSLGSTADSPPSSLRGSPTTMSPTSMLSDDSLMGSLGSTTMSGISMFSSTPPPQSAPPGFTGAFTFPQHQQQEVLSSLVAPPPVLTPPVMSPLNVHTATSQDPMIASLAAEMQAASLQQQLNNAASDTLIRDCGLVGDVFSFMPPSPPHSLGSEDSSSSQDSGVASMPPTPTPAPQQPAAPATVSPMDLSRTMRLPIFKQVSATL